MESLRLAWSADRLRLIVAAAVNGITAAAEVASIYSSARAVDAAVSGSPPRSQTVRLLALAGLGLVNVVGRSASSVVEAPLGQAVMRRAEGGVLDVVAALELADGRTPRSRTGCSGR